MAAAAILKSEKIVISRQRFVRFRANLEWRRSATLLKLVDGWHVKIITESRISVWRRSFFHTGSSYNSAVASDIVINEIWYTCSWACS